MYHLDCKWQKLNSNLLREMKGFSSAWNPGKIKKNKTIGGYRWSWAWGEAEPWDGTERCQPLCFHLLSLLLSVWRPHCFSLKPNFFCRGSNYGHQQLLNSKSDCFCHQEVQTYRCSLNLISEIPGKDFCLAQFWKGVNLLTNQTRPGGWVI